MKMPDFKQSDWKRDVESFARWRALYDRVSHRGRENALKYMQDLQSRWPHKLGDMPEGEA